MDINALWSVLIGMVGGIANSLLVDDGFAVPHVIQEQSRRVWKIGFLRNVMLGGIAAFATYALGASELNLLRQLGIALLSGVGGANVLTTLMQKHETSLLKARVDTLQAVVRQTTSDKGSSEEGSSGNS